MNIIKNFPILLPKNIDYTKWATIACDQYTTDHKYWANLKEYVGDTPSALHIIFPEIYLNQPDMDDRIESINKNMYKYLSTNLFKEIDGFILTEREIDEGRNRIGLVLCVDLEEYDYKQQNVKIRSTEETIEDRLPIRMHVRKNAPIELPHILLLIDDTFNTIIEPLYAKKNELEKLYDFELNMNGGHIKGYKVPYNNELIDKFNTLIDKDLQEKKYGRNAGIMFAVGDGNHSMATAKKCWEQIKDSLTEEEKTNHPARYVLVEVINIYDKSIDFEPIHRIVYNCNKDLFIKELTNELDGENNSELTIITSEGTKKILCSDKSEQVIIKIQSFLEKQKEKNNISIEYVHEEEQVYKDTISLNGIGILMPKFPKNKLFDYVVNVGKLPKKAFSIGEEKTKKYYIEAKRIK